jgi:hypothetical protein
MVGTGRFATVEEACAACVREVSEAKPGVDAARYAKGHEVYRSLYPALKGAFHAMA